ncbi:MAG: thioredoxin family protein [Planctomycetota bacterium]|jgi:hypothetical protein
MKRPAHRFGILLLLFAFVAVPLFAGEGGSPDPVSWITKPKEAEAAARESGKPILAHLRAEKCKWCRKMERSTHPDPRVLRILNRVVPLWLDVSKPSARFGRDLLRKAGLKGVPATLILDDRWNLVRAVSGFKAPDAYVEEVGGVVKAHGDRKAFGPKVEAGEADYATLHAYLKACHVLGLSDEVRKYAEKALALGEKGGDHGPEIAYFLARALGPGHAGYPEAKARVLRLDPENQTGYFDDLVIAEAVALAEGSRTEGEAKANAARARKLIENRFAMETPRPVASKAQTLYWILFQLWCRQGTAEADWAKAVLRKGIALDPDSAMAKKMKEALKKLD